MMNTFASRVPALLVRSQLSSAARLYHLSSRFGAKPPPADASVLASLRSPLILDVRDPKEVAKGKGGPPAVVPGSVNVPLNHDGIGQKERPTTLEEFQAKLAAAGVSLPADKSSPIVTHCGSGGRGGRAASLLTELGYTNAHNGGGPSHIAKSLGL